MAKSQFINVGSLRPVGNAWVIQEQFVYHSELLGRRITVPHGFVTDLASVPKIVPRFIVDVATGKNRKAAIIHDPLCLDEFKRKYGISQDQADLVFREALMVCGVKKWQANILYTAVAA